MKKRLTAFTLAEVLIAKREREKMSLLNLSRMSELKAPSNEFKKRCAFTLAEVLITLGIIGIIAAITIPTLVQNYQKTQYVASLKKAYTQMNQVLLQMAIDNGTPDSIADYYTGGDDNTVGAKIASYYKVVKVCLSTQQDDECFAKFDNSYDGSANSTTEWNNVKNWYKFITADGMSFSMGSYNNSCTKNNGFDAAPDAPVTNHTCGWVFIDVNGKKKPNNYGRDVFAFRVTSNKVPLLYPAGGFYNSWGNTGTIAGGGSEWWNYLNHNYCGIASKNGYHCAGRIMDEGWEMNY